MFDFRYFYAPTKDKVERCHPAMCGYIATNHKLDTSFDILKSGVVLYFDRSKCSASPSFPLMSPHVKCEDYTRVFKEDFLKGIQSIGFIISPKIGQIVRQVTIGYTAQVINVFGNEVQLEDCDGCIRRTSIESIAEPNGIDLMFYKGKGKASFKVDFTGKDENALQSGDKITEEKCINHLSEPKEVTLERQIIALQKELNELKRLRK